MSGAIATTSNTASRFARYVNYEDSLRDSALGTFNMLLADATHLYAYCNTHLHWLTRRAPFGEARSIDTGERVDFHELTTPNDIVTLVASRPLTDNEVWHAMTPPRLTVWRAGVAVASVAAGRLET